MKKIIRGGKIVTESAVFEGDLLIEDEKIAAVGAHISDSDAEIINAGGSYVLPGGVDIHTHMDLDVGIARVIDDFYTGTVAAACGGTTTIVDHMAFGPAGCDLRHQIDEYHRLADGKAVIDYGFHGVIQHVDEKILSQMGEIADTEGVTSFKVYLTYGFMIQDKELTAVLRQAKKDDILIAVHCENDGLIAYLRQKFVAEGKTQAMYHPLSRPDQAEAEAVSRLLHLASAADEAPVYIVHLSSAAGLREVIKARKAGQKHFAAETCPQYLLLDDTFYEDPQEGLKAIMAPPLRKQADQEALWQGLREGYVGTIATDHCPFTFGRQKQQGAEDFTRCPSGAPGVEERLMLMFSEGFMKGRLTLPELVTLLSANPARVAGIYPQKGTLLPGSDADIVLIDPERSSVISQDQMHGAGDYTCYEGFEIKGKLTMVMQRGRVIVKDGAFLGEKGGGRYLKRGRHMDLF